MRGRYNADGSTSQQIGDEISNAITTVQKDTLVLIMKEKQRFLKSLYFFAQKEPFLKNFLTYNNRLKQLRKEDI